MEEPGGLYIVHVVAESDTTEHALSLSLSLSHTHTHTHTFNRVVGHFVLHCLEALYIPIPFVI